VVVLNPPIITQVVHQKKLTTKPQQNLLLVLVQVHVQVLVHAVAILREVEVIPDPVVVLPKEVNHQEDQDHVQGVSALTRAHQALSHYLLYYMLAI
jgi:hypothetical protein